MIDILMQWCVFVDYPLLRATLTKYRQRFGKIIIYPSRHHGVIDLEEFAKKVFPETWVDPVPIDYGVQDWRQAETEPLLAKSNSEWILFMEQDFFVKDWNKLWDDIEVAMKQADLIGWWNETHFPYVHPCFLLIKRDLLEKTGKDFRAHPEISGCDHFAMITHQAQELGARVITIQSLGYKEWENAFHLGGLTYPMQNWKGDGTDHFGVKNLEAYYIYLGCARQAQVEQSAEYFKLSLEIESRLKSLLPSVDLSWKEFFL